MTFILTRVNMQRRAAVRVGEDVSISFTSNVLGFIAHKFNFSLVRVFWVCLYVCWASFAGALTLLIKLGWQKKK